MHLSISYLFVLVIGGAATSRPVQDPPTLEQTTAFLVDKLDGSRFDYKSAHLFPDGSKAEMRSTLQEWLSFSGCEGHIRIHLLTETWDRRGAAWEVSQDEDIVDMAFRAKDLRLNSGSIKPWEEEQTSSPSLVQVVLPGRHGDALAIVADPQLAVRIQKAQIGLGALCGAKGEAY